MKVSTIKNGLRILTAWLLSSLLAFILLVALPDNLTEGSKMIFAALSYFFSFTLFDNSLKYAMLSIAERGTFRHNFKNWGKTKLLSMSQFAQVALFNVSIWAVSAAFAFHYFVPLGAGWKRISFVVIYFLTFFGLQKATQRLRQHLALQTQKELEQEELRVNTLIEQIGEREV